MPPTDLFQDLLDEGIQLIRHGRRELQPHLYHGRLYPPDHDPLRIQIPQFRREQQIRQPDLVGRHFERKVGRHLITGHADQRPRPLAHLDRIDDDQMRYAFQAVEKLKPHRSSVDDLDLVRQIGQRLQSSDRVNASAVIGLDEVSDP